MCESKPLNPYPDCPLWRVRVLDKETREERYSCRVMAPTHVLAVERMTEMLEPCVIVVAG